MSVMLPNGNFISVRTLEELQEIRRKIEAREPIISRHHHSDGTVTEHVLWSPDDPPPIPAPHQSPPPPSERTKAMSGFMINLSGYGAAQLSKDNDGQWTFEQIEELSREIRNRTPPS